MRNSNGRILHPKCIQEVLARNILGVRVLRVPSRRIRVHLSRFSKIIKGQSIVNIHIDKFYILFTFLMILITMLGRFVGIFILPCILTIFRRDYSLNSKELWLIWYSGVIKGTFLLIRRGGLCAVPNYKILKPADTSNYDHFHRGDHTHFIEWIDTEILKFFRVGINFG